MILSEKFESFRNKRIKIFLTSGNCVEGRLISFDDIVLQIETGNAMKQSFTRNVVIDKIEMYFLSEQKE